MCRELLAGGGTYCWGFEPRVGEAVLWWNINEAGKEDPGTLHAGDPVLAGEKWALNIWLRQHPRRQSGAGDGGGGERNEEAAGDPDDDEGGNKEGGGMKEGADGLAEVVSTLAV